MAISEILTIIGLALLYGSALITSYLNIRIKIKELEVKILNLQKDFDSNKSKVENDIKKLEDRNTIEHDAIINKIDELIEKITDVRIVQASKDK